MTLTVEDLATLSHADLEEGFLNLSSREVVVSPESPKNLIAAGLVEKGGKLTEVGIEKVTALQDRLTMLRKGLPFKKRTKADHKKITTLGTKWVTGQLKTKDYMTNGEIWIYGKPYASMDASVGSPELRKASLPTLQKVLKGKQSDFLLVKPYWWMVIELGSLEVIWLRNEEKDIGVPIQASYFDYTTYRYPSVKFYVRKDGCGPLVGKVKNRGVYADVVSIIQPLVPGANVPTPEDDDA